MSRNPFILIRENALPKDRLELQMDRSTFVRLHDMQIEWDRLKNIIISELESCFGAMKVPGILELKRTIYNDRTAKAKGLKRKLEPVLPKEVLSLLKAYFRTAEERDILQQEALGQSLTRTNDFRASMIRLFAEHEEVLSGILMINPGIYHKLIHYLNTPIEKHRSKHRKLESTLYKFLTRALLKTSPFVSITRVGRAEDRPSLLAKTEQQQYCSHVSINLTLLYRLMFYFLYRSERFIKTVTFHLPPYSIRQQDGVHFISFLSRKDLPTNNKLYLPSETLGELKIPAVLARLFEAKELDDPITFEEMMKCFNGQIREDKMCEIMKKYAEIGLLVPAVGFDEGSSDLMMDDMQKVAAAYLDEDDFNRFARLTASLKEIVDNISQRRGLKDRFSAFHELHQFKERLLAETGLEFPENAVLYEDGIIQHLSPIDLGRLEHADAYLRKLQAFSLLFDANIRLQYRMGYALFEASQGKEMEIDSDFFSVLFSVSKEMIPYWEDAAYTSKDIDVPEIVLLDNLKTIFLKEFQELCLQCSADVIDLAELMDRYINRIPSRMIQSTDLSSTFFMQFRKDNIIINAMYEGHEKYKARFMNYFKDYLTEDSEYLEFIGQYYAGQNYYEYTESFGFNGNVKEVKLHRECYTMGVGTRRFTPQADRLLTRVEDFTVSIDPSNKKFRLIDRNKQPVKICFRGSLVPTSMPGYISVLLQLFSSGSLLLKLSELLEQERIPRIMYGPLVLNRKRIRLEQLARDLIRKTGESSEDYFMRVNMFFTEYKLDSTFFVTAKRDFLSEDAYIRDFKPLYIDIANPIALKVFENEVLSYIEKPWFQNFYMEEVLGDEELVATEYDVEIYKKEGEPVGSHHAYL